VEALTAAAAAGVAMSYVLPAIRDLGEKVLEASEDAVSNAVVGFGKRLLHALLDRRARADQSGPEAAALRNGIERRVLVLARDLGQRKAASQSGRGADIGHRDRPGSLHIPRPAPLRIHMGAMMAISTAAARNE
jgi:hypothetical protein